MTRMTHSQLIAEVFATFPRRPDPRGCCTVVISEAELFRAVAALMSAAQRRTVTQAHEYLRRDVARVN